MTRRTLLLSFPALAVRAQSAKPTIPVTGLSHMTLFVSDVKRSFEFYQGLFAMPTLARQHGPLLQIGPGRQFMALGSGSGGGKGGAGASISHFCMTTDNFNVDKILKILAEYGITKSENPAAGTGLSGGAMKARVRMRGPEEGGAKEGTAELYFGDPDGIVVQLQDTTYCGGAGPLGEACLATPEPASKKGLIALTGLSHFTLNVSNQQLAAAFYRGLFDMKILAYQGAMPVLAAGPERQFIACAPSTATPAIHHVCFTMDAFHPDKVLRTLADYGIKTRGDASGPAPPLTSWVRMRGPEWGGAKDGTPELYFTDPDGITLQLQDSSYCGGAGYLGNVCS